MVAKLRPWLLGLVPLAYLWFTVINQLRPEWDSNPQYSYGWVVPILCLGLIWQRTSWFARLEEQSAPPPWGRTAAWTVVILGALFFLPSRMLQAADPAWRLTSWLLALDVVAITLAAVYLAGGGGWLRRYAFPICFFLVAVPWLYPIEKWLIERLTFAASAATVEVMGVVGIPAFARGKVIEVGTGVVGIDEACSGIRSFQSSLMISLFLGAFYSLSVWRRVLLVPLGFVLAFIFNICRTSILTYIAATKGVGAIADYHDQAGISILLACTVALWLISLLLRPKVLRAEPTSPAPVTTETGPGVPSPVVDPPFSLRSRGLLVPAVVLVVWLGAVEVGVDFWSSSSGNRAATGTKWSIAWPKDNPTFKQVEADQTTWKLLQFDEAQFGNWQEQNGISWSAYYFNWFPGKVGAYLAANRHSPEICMTYAGWEMRSGPAQIVLPVKGLHLPFRRYTFAQDGRGLHVFHCRWEPAFESNPALLQQTGSGTTWRGFRGLSVLWSGKGKGGQKILELIVRGCETEEQAQAALVEQLEKLIQIEPRSAQAQTTGT